MSDNYNGLTKATIGLGIGGGLATNIVGGLLSHWSQNKMLEKQQKFIEKENAIMREREDTAIRRQMNDMIASGINPMLAGMQGGAGTQQGGMIGLQSGVDWIGALNSANDTVQGSLANANEMVKTPSQVAKTKAEALKIGEEVKKLIKLTPIEEETMYQNLNNMSAEELLTWQQVLTETNRTENVYNDTLLKIAQTELTETENRLTGKQITDLMNKFADRDWYNLYMRFNDAVANVRASDLTAQQRRNAELEMYEIINRTEKYDHDMVMDELRYALEKVISDRKLVNDILGSITEGLARGASGR